MDNHGAGLRFRKFHLGYLVGSSNAYFLQVSPDAYQSGDIICHRGATPGQAHIPVTAGQQVQLFWNTWPPGHKGPVIDYIAACPNNDCTTVDKTKLSFVKINEVGLLSGPSPGTWGE